MLLWMGSEIKIDWIEKGNVTGAIARFYEDR